MRRVYGLGAEAIRAVGVLDALFVGIPEAWFGRVEMTLVGAMVGLVMLSALSLLYGCPPLGDTFRLFVLVCVCGGGIIGWTSSPESV